MKKIRLLDGREISEVSTFVRNLAVEGMAGIAPAVLNANALKLAKRVWPDEPCLILDADLIDHSNSICSSQFLIMSEFVSSTIPGSAEVASAMVVIWFQGGLTSDYEEPALKKLVSIQWNANARSFSW